MIDIDETIKRKGFTLYYQPKIDLKTLKVIGAEALIRLKEKDKIIPPSQFIPQAEKNNDIIKIDKWVFNRVVNDAREIFVKTNCKILISFNVSGQHFEKECFLKNLEKIFSSTKDFLGLFEIEITETSIINNVKNAKKNLERLKHIGFSISIDDFGTGWGGLSYLLKLPIDTIKIDKIFIDNIEKDEKALGIVESLIYLCKRLNIKSIAEGVEDIHQVDILKDIGCDVIQGYYYAKPMPIGKFIAFVNAQNNNTETRFINWSEKYSVGSYALDSQHMIVINILNKLFEILRIKKEREEFPLEYFVEIFDEYLLKHFRTEEAIMKRYNYPLIDEHISEHMGLMETYNEFKENLTEINERDLFNLFNMIKDYFLQHELKEDKKMLTYIKKHK